MKNNIQDIQIFLTRATGLDLNLERKIPSEQNTNINREFYSKTVYESSSKTEFLEEFPIYTAIANSEAVENIRFNFSPKYLHEFVRRIANNEVDMNECIDFGTNLFHDLFQKSIRDIFRVYTKENKKLRLTIATSEPELLVIPWELLCDKQFGVLPKFLSQNKNIVLSRSIRLFNRGNFSYENISNDTIKILLVTASPHNLPLLDSIKEEMMLRFVIEEHSLQEKVELHVLHDATVSQLRKKLDDIKPHIVHISCHGGFNEKEGYGLVALCAEDNKAEFDLVNAYRLAALLSEQGSVRFVFSSTCFGATQNPVYTYSGVAACLHASGISAVASLQFNLFDRTGHALALNFYHHLLGEQRSIEDCITHTRQYLFFNNFIIHECFGLTFFQENISLGMNFKPETDKFDSISVENELDINKKFTERLYQHFFENISSSFDDMIKLFHDLSTFKTEDIPYLFYIFDDLKVAVKILLEIQSAGIALTPFLKMAKLAKTLCQSKDEQKPIITSILLNHSDDIDAYIEQNKLYISEKLREGFFDSEIKVIIGEAIKVNGFDRAFSALINKDKQNFCFEQIRNINNLDGNAIEIGSIIGDPKWKNVFSATVDNGCAFILSGYSTFKIVIQGNQIAEYRNGIWNYATIALLRDILPELVIRSGIGSAVLLDVAQKAVTASEQGKGKAFIVRQNKGTEPRLVDGYKDIVKMEGPNELKDKKIMDFNSVDYLGLINGDGAVIISSQGETLAINAKLDPDSKTIVQPLIGHGTRHLSSQKITKESNTVAFVVSDDGPLTIFFEGNVFFRK